MVEHEADLSMEWSQRLAAGSVGADLTRPSVGAIPLGGLVRYLLFSMMFVATLMFYVWSRIDVRDSAKTLDSVITQYNTLQVERSRLELEMASRLSLVRVSSAASQMELVTSDGLEVVDLR
jgi:cell division protein FtsL